MKWRTEHTTGVILLVALALPVFIYFAAFRAAAGLTSSLGWASHSQAVMLELDDVQLRMAAAADQQNRYLLHPTAAGLAGYRGQLAAARRGLAQLDAMTGDNQVQKKSLAALTAAVDGKQEELDREVALSLAGHGPEAIQAANSDLDVVQSQTVRLRAAAAQQEEQTLLANRRAEARGFQRSWVRLFWGACLFSLALLLVVFALLVREIVRRRHAQEALVFSHRQLEESWDRYRSLIANVPAAVWTMARGGATEFVSAHVQALTGYPPAEVVAGGAAFWTDLIHSDDRAEVADGLARLFDTETDFSAEFRVRHRAGHWVWLQARGQHVRQQDGGDRADGVFYDISESKQRAESELRQRELEIRERETRRSLDFKSDLLASVSHELRTPLSAILGFSELLAQGEGGTLSPEQSEFARRIHNSGEHLLAVINDVLDLSRIEANAMPLRPEAMALALAAEDALATMEPLAARKDLRLDRDLEPDLVVYADPVRVRQILLNLLSNAVKFTRAGGEIRVLARREPGRVRITVRDTGAGIAPEHLQTIFDRFQQAGGDARQEGSGLGLAITKHLVQRQGGELTVESVLGQGSSFRFTLPSAASATALEAPQARLAASSTSADS